MKLFIAKDGLPNIQSGDYIKQNHGVYDIVISVTELNESEKKAYGLDGKNFGIAHTLKFSKHLNRDRQTDELIDLISKASEEEKKIYEIILQDIV